MEVKGGIVSHYYILVICNFIAKFKRNAQCFFCFSDIVGVLLFPLNSLPPQSLEYAI